MEAISSFETSVNCHKWDDVRFKVLTAVSINTVVWKTADVTGELNVSILEDQDRLCGLVVRVLGYRSRGPGSILPEKKVVGLERGPLSLVSTTEELLDRKVAAPV
jgi:hypothetical protein